MITIDIELASLKDVPKTDASYTPTADQWRSDVSSSLWDAVVLHTHGDVSIDRIIPFTDYKNRKVNVKFDLDAGEQIKGKAAVQIIDGKGKVVISQEQRISGNQGEVGFDIKDKLKSWSPGNPNIYRLKLSIINAKGDLTDRSEIPFGVKNFELRDKRFYLNVKHFLAKGVIVVWHRWVRTPEIRKLGYDTTWFKKNIITLSQDHGANYIRFNLGLPTEEFLDICDKYGLFVQYEWSFFYEMPASKESLLIQYKNWLDLAMRHPSVTLIHPYNETRRRAVENRLASVG